MSMGKGSKRRPSLVTEAELRDRSNAVWKRSPTHSKTQRHVDKRRKALDKQLRREQYREDN